ncbi:MAG TPA: pyridoxal phosphate-dependent aminotransferase [Armatimonadota bacterium]|nr:pyridoxal phosphate-dependent aminotransferase [Armatimonadota bacterium]
MTRISQRARDCAPSPTLAITAKYKAMQAQGIDVIGFGAGEPDFDTPEHIKQAAVEALSRGETKYTASSGIPPLREAICEKLQRENGLAYAPNQIIVNVGAKHTIYNAFQALLDPGDEVIIPVPYWVSYPEQVKLAGGVPVFVDAPERNGFKLTADAVAAAVTPRTKILVLNSPSNPSGAVVEEAELRKIAALAVDRDLLVLSDEIYEHLTYGREHVSIASFGPEVQKRTLLVNGFSKAYSMTGWRLGWMAGDPEIIAAMGRIQDQSTSNPTSFAQWGGVAALRGPQDCVEQMRQAFEQRRNYIVQRLNAIPGVSCVTPEGAFYVLPNVSGLTGPKLPDGDAVAEHLLTEAKIAVVPGSGFGVPQNIRLSYATGMQAIEKGMDRLEAAAKALVG